MLQIGRMATPSETHPAFERDIRQIERSKKGTVLNDAVVLEREKRQRRENPQKEEQHPLPKHPEAEHPLHVYTAGATESELDDARSDLNVVA